jgi:excisionase family DNA binding protein
VALGRLDYALGRARLQEAINGGSKMQREETVLAVGIAEAARRLGLSSRTVATLIMRRQIASRKVGRRRIVPVAALEAFMRRDHSTKS